MSQTIFYLVASALVVLAYTQRRKARGLIMRIHGSYYVRVKGDAKEATAVRPDRYPWETGFLKVVGTAENDDARLTVETEVARRGYVEVGSGLWRYND